MSDAAVSEGPTRAQAEALEQAGRLVEADAHIDKVLALTPDDVMAIHYKGMLAVRLGRLGEAAALMERSIALAPGQAHLRRNLCEVYRLLGRYDEALAAGESAARDAPGDPLCHANLSVLHYERVEPDAAMAAARRAIALAPQLPGGHFGLAEAALLKGEMAVGWEEYEWRYRLAGVPTLVPDATLPQWDGAPLGEGGLILVADQGFGDCIQFARYIPWARARCPNLAIAASRELWGVLALAAPGVPLFDAWAQAPASAAYAPLSGLPRLHGTRLESIPTQIPYLHADPAAADTWRRRLDQLTGPGYRRVGLVWAGRPTHRNDRNRSAALANLAPITDADGVAFVALQKGEAAAQVGGYFGRAPLINLGPELDDFTDTLAVIDGLDLVLSVDTAVVHLAGAAGKPTWVMLPHAPDWRWLIGRSDSPWYPSARLFRPPAPRDWARVVADVAGALRERWGL